MTIRFGSGPSPTASSSGSESRPRADAARRRDNPRHALRSSRGGLGFRACLPRPFWESKPPATKPAWRWFTPPARRRRSCSRMRSTARSRCTPVRRRRPGARFARPHPPRAAADARGAAPSRRALADVDAVAYTRGPGLAGALLVGAGVACALAAALAGRRSASITSKATCSRRSCRADPPSFPFVALLVSGGHTQLMHVDDVGRYAAARRHHRRRRRRGVRQVGQAARARLSGRPGAGATGRVRRPERLSRCRVRCCSATRSTSPSPA